VFRKHAGFEHSIPCLTEAEWGESRLKAERAWFLDRRERRAILEGEPLRVPPSNAFAASPSRTLQSVLRPRGHTPLEPPLLCPSAKQRSLKTEPLLARWDKSGMLSNHSGGALQTVFSSPSLIHSQSSLKKIRCICL